MDHLLSVDRARRFKPHPSVYRLAVEATGLPAERIGFVTAQRLGRRGRGRLRPPGGLAPTEPCRHDPAGRGACPDHRELVGAPGDLRDRERRGLAGLAGLEVVFEMDAGLQCPVVLLGLVFEVDLGGLQGHVLVGG